MKVEISPSDRVKCTKCTNKIDKGDLRVKITSTSYGKFTTHKYYHVHCMKALIDELAYKLINDYNKPIKREKFVFRYDTKRGDSNGRRSIKE